MEKDSKNLDPEYYMDPDNYMDAYLLAKLYYNNMCVTCIHSKDGICDNKDRCDYKHN